MYDKIHYKLKKKYKGKKKKTTKNVEEVIAKRQTKCSASSHPGPCAPAQVVQPWCQPCIDAVRNRIPSDLKEVSALFLDITLCPGGERGGGWL